MGLNGLLGFKGPAHLMPTQTHPFDTPKIKTQQWRGLEEKEVAQEMANWGNFYNCLDEEMLFLKMNNLLPNLRSLCHRSC
jgi:hypothetical protein